MLGTARPATRRETCPAPPVVRPGAQKGRQPRSQGGKDRRPGSARLRFRPRAGGGAAAACVVAEGAQLRRMRTRTRTRVGASGRRVQPRRPLPATGGTAGWVRSAAGSRGGWGEGGGVSARAGREGREQACPLRQRPSPHPRLSPSPLAPGSRGKQRYCVSSGRRGGGGGNLHLHGLLRPPPAPRPWGPSPGQPVPAPSQDGHHPRYVPVSPRGAREHRPQTRGHPREESTPSRPWSSWAPTRRQAPLPALRGSLPGEATRHYGAGKAWRQAPGVSGRPPCPCVPGHLVPSGRSQPLSQQRLLGGRGCHRPDPVLWAQGYFVGRGPTLWPQVISLGPRLS